MRFLGFILRLSVVAALVIWLAGQPGTARIVWHDYRIETSAGFLFLLLAMAAFVLYEVFRAWRFLKDGPRFWRLRNRINRMEKGQTLMTRGLAAIAAGDAAEAGRFAVAARRLLGMTTATRLLQAQAARLAGDHRAANELFRAITDDPDGAVLGYRGLIMAAIRSGDWDEAERQMERLRRLKPSTPWLHLMRLEIAARRQDWKTAVSALESAMSAKALDPYRARRHQAALLASSSEREAQEGHAMPALHSAEKAAKYAPDWLPALLVLAQRQLDGQHYRSALRTIERGWRLHPHPQLAALHEKAVRARNPLERHKSMARLTRDKHDDVASRLALAETAMAADLWGEARRHLMTLAGRSDAPVAVYRMLARLERRESGNDSVVCQWLSKAAEASPDPQWLCTACGGGHEKWQGVCRYCGAFNTLDWQTPGQGRRGSLPPLIAGPDETMLSLIR